MKAKRDMAVELAKEKASLTTAVRTKQQQVRRQTMKEDTLSKKSKYLVAKYDGANVPINKVQNQIRSPTTLSNTAPSTAFRRSKETFEITKKIHGASNGNRRPAFDGLFDTLQKKCKTSELGDYVLSNDKVTKDVIQKKQKFHQEVFYSILF